MLRNKRLRNKGNYLSLLRTHEDHWKRSNFHHAQIEQALYYDNRLKQTGTPHLNFDIDSGTFYCKDEWCTINI